MHRRAIVESQLIAVEELIVDLKGLIKVIYEDYFLERAWVRVLGEAGGCKDVALLQV